MDDQVGDKIGIREGQFAGQRGSILAVTEGVVTVQLGEDAIVSLPKEALRNYSLAARRAWRTRPKKAGRPRKTQATRKKMVSIRVDSEVWDLLAVAVDRGLIISRERAVNEWLAQKVVELGLLAQHDEAL